MYHPPPQRPPVQLLAPGGAWAWVSPHARRGVPGLTHREAGSCLALRAEADAGGVRWRLVNAGG